MTPTQRLGARISMALGIGRQTADTDETGGTATLQVTLPHGELRSDVPLVQHYGLASRPTAGADVVVSFQAGDRTRGVAIASGDQRYRPTNLGPTDVCLYQRSGSRAWLKDDGSLQIVSPSTSTTGNLIAGVGASGSFTTSTGQIVTVRDGIITNIF